VGAAIEWLVFSNVWVAAAAGALCAAASRAMGLAPDARVSGVALAGTLVVYGVDRLRDLERDRHTAPRRSAFVARHRLALGLFCAGAAGVAAACAGSLGLRAVLLLAPVLGLGLLHRRLKRIPYAKAAYISAAWLVVVVGLPAALAPPARDAGWVGAVLGLALLANAVASNVRDAEAGAARFGTGPALWAARGGAALGAAVGALAPAPVRPLAVVPLATLLVLIPFRRDEAYGLLVVDGALLLGAALALVWLG
jgi:hypothetical protein